MTRLPHPGRVLLSLTAVTWLAAATASADPQAAQEPSQATPPLAPSKGEIIPAFETLGIDGQAHKVTFPKGSKTVLLFFMSGCPHCHKMIPEWNRAYDRRPADLKVYGVLMDLEPPGFWSTMPVSFPVLRSPGREFLRQLNVNRVPLVVRVADGGRIDDVAMGETDLIRLGELFKP
ncbi:MAG TPA: TlpA disulfide reductase family protein [Vicinamibacteria bacterium]|nr:TlpA disulfide reductase family protein [Vicinamibacteria bacterium]